MKKESALKIGISVFLVFVLCTILSRGLYSFSVANVTLTTPQKYTIDHSVMTLGRVEAISELPVLIDEGLVIVEYYVLEGEKIEKGSPLLRVDIEKLKEELGELKKEISVLSLQIKEAKAADNLSVQNEIIEKEYAKKNYERLERKYQKELEKQLDNWNVAKENYETYKLQDEVDKNYLVELEIKMNEQEELYNNLLDAKEQELLDAKKTMEIANIQGAKSTSGEQLEIQKHQIENKMNDLEKLIEKKGIIYAEYTGTVTQLNVGIGEITSDSAVLLISDDKKGFKVTLSLEKDLENYIDIDTKVILKGMKNGENIKAQGTSILSLNSNAEDIEAIISLKDNRFSVGMNVDVEILLGKFTYDNCVPMQAVHQESSNTYFVYIVDQKESVLGEELIARRIPIKIIDKDYMFVAIEDGEISSDTEIVLASDKIIDNESTIRIKGLQ